MRTTKIATFALLGVIGVLGPDARAQPAVKGGNMIPAQNMSGADFLALLGRIVGDGDLRNIKRFADVLGVSLSLEPKFVPEDGVRLGRVAVVFKPPLPLFTPPDFRYDFSIQDSAPQVQPYPKLIAVMIFSLGPKDPCVTRDGLAQQFGPGFVDDRGPLPGPNPSLVKQIGSGHDYRTELTAGFERGKDCSDIITVSQTSHGSYE